MTGRTALWPEFARFADAPQLTQIDAKEMSEPEFAREFVDAMRPCLVKGAVRAWPAFERWQSPDYLRARLGSRPVRVHTRRRIEHRAALQRNPALHAMIEGAIVDMSFEQALSKMTTETGHCVMHSYRLAEPSPLAPLADDMGGFPFVSRAAPSRSYAGARAFVYRDGNTDWHYHATDETLMCQLVGTKETLLLPPDADTFRIMTQIADDVGYFYDTDPARFPRFAQLRPHRVVVEPGDALYIPTFWWHAVRSIPGEWGVTVSWCWGTPTHLFDPRLAGVRRTLREQLFTRHSPLALCAASWSLLHTLAHRRWSRPLYRI